MTRQPYQVIDDMFGRIVTSNEPFLVVYLPGGIPVPSLDSPILPMKAYIDNIGVSNDGTLSSLIFSNSSLDLSGCPCVGRLRPARHAQPLHAARRRAHRLRHRPLPDHLLGHAQQRHRYARRRDQRSLRLHQGQRPHLYAGKKVGDLVLTWVSQEQGDVQIIGYVEGAPPAPMANLTNKSSYAGATSVTLSAPTSVTLKYSQQQRHLKRDKLGLRRQLRHRVRPGLTSAPFGFGVKADKQAMTTLDFTAG